MIKAVYVEGAALQPAPHWSVRIRGGVLPYIALTLHTPRIARGQTMGARLFIPLGSSMKLVDGGTAMSLQLRKNTKSHIAWVIVPVIPPGQEGEVLKATMLTLQNEWDTARRACYWLRAALPLSPYVRPGRSRVDGSHRGHRARRHHSWPAAAADPPKVHPAVCTRAASAPPALPRRTGPSHRWNRPIHVMQSDLAQGQRRQNNANASAGPGFRGRGMSSLLDRGNSMFNRNGPYAGAQPSRGAHWTGGGGGGGGGARSGSDRVSDRVSLLTTGSGRGWSERHQDAPFRSSGGNYGSSHANESQPRWGGRNGGGGGQSSAYEGGMRYAAAGPMSIASTATADVSAAGLARGPPSGGGYHAHGFAARDSRDHMRAQHRGGESAYGGQQSYGGGQGGGGYGGGQYLAKGPPGQSQSYRGSSTRVESSSSSSRGADPRAYGEDRGGGFDRGFAGPVPAEGPPPYEAYVQDRAYHQERFHDAGQYGAPQHQQQYAAQQGGYRPVEEQRGGGAGYGREGEFWAPTEVQAHRGRQPRYGGTPGYMEQDAYPRKGFSTEQDPYPRKGFSTEAPPPGYYQQQQAQAQQAQYPQHYRQQQQVQQQLYHQQQMQHQQYRQSTHLDAAQSGYEESAASGGVYGGGGYGQGDESARHWQQQQRGEVQYFSAAPDASGMPAAYHRPAAGLQTMPLPSLSLGSSLGLGAPLTAFPPPALDDGGSGSPWDEKSLI